MTSDLGYVFRISGQILISVPWARLKIKLFVYKSGVEKKLAVWEYFSSRHITNVCRSLDKTKTTPLISGPAPTCVSKHYTLQSSVPKVWCSSPRSIVETYLVKGIVFFPKKNCPILMPPLCRYYRCLKLYMFYICMYILRYFHFLRVDRYLSSSFPYLNVDLRS